MVSKMAADGHLGMTALSHVTLASAGLSCIVCLPTHYEMGGVNTGSTNAVIRNPLNFQFRRHHIFREVVYCRLKAHFFL